MLSILKGLTKLWVILGLVFIVLYCTISFLFKKLESAPVDNKFNGVEIDPKTYLCVSQLALIDGDCSKRRDIDCETLVKSYEASCFPQESFQEKEIEQRMRERLDALDKSSRNQK